MSRSCRRSRLESECLSERPNKIERIAAVQRQFGDLAIVHNGSDRAIRCIENDCRGFDGDAFFGFANLHTEVNLATCSQLMSVLLASSA